jgi:uncharacterized membrane protein YfcA
VEAALHLTPLEYALALAIVAVGAAVQGSVGFGANLLAVPVLALLEPESLPTTLTLVIIPLAAVMARRERHGVDWAGVGWLMAGRLPGTVLGALVVASVAGDTISVLAGSGVLLAVGMSVLSTRADRSRRRGLQLPRCWSAGCSAAGSAPNPRAWGAAGAQPARPPGTTTKVTPGTTVAAGVASGAMGTATSIGGPPLGLLYQHHEGPVIRGTLAVTFGIGTLVSLVGLAAAQAVAGWHVALALALLPGTLAGLWVSGPLIRRLDGPWLRPALLAFAAVTAAVAVVRGLA